MNMKNYKHSLNLRKSCEQLSPQSICLAFLPSEKTDSVVNKMKCITWTKTLTESQELGLRMVIKLIFIMLNTLNNLKMHLTFYNINGHQYYLCFPKKILEHLDVRVRGISVVLSQNPHSTRKTENALTLSLYISKCFVRVGLSQKEKLLPRRDSFHIVPPISKVFHWRAEKV